LSDVGSRYGENVSGDHGDHGEQDAPGDPESVARAICLQQLTQRARSRAELATVLRRRGVPDDAARTVLDRFVEVGLIDDESLAQNLALAQHTARRLVARKLPSLRGLPEQARVRRLIGLLARRGYSSALATTVVREALGAGATEAFDDG
jgi:regulatory protein